MAVTTLLLLQKQFKCDGNWDEKKTNVMSLLKYQHTQTLWKASWK